MEDSSRYQPFKPVSPDQQISYSVLLIHTSLGTPPPPVGKFMVGVVGDFSLQSMGQTNHKFPCNSGLGVGREVIATVQAPPPPPPSRSY